MKRQTMKDPRKRKMLLVLPLLIIPFITMVFWAMGGGKSLNLEDHTRSAGLNLQLPNAQLKDDKGENKLSYYEEAEKDSAIWRRKLEDDPFYSELVNDSFAKKTFDFTPYPLQVAHYKDPNEQKVYKKLADLNRHLKEADKLTGIEGEGEASIPSDGNSLDQANVSRLEEMMHAVSSPNTKDPQVEQLNSMMDRILDIQHPERVRQRLTEELLQDQPQYLSVRKNTYTCSISLLDTCKQPPETNSFNGSDVNTGASDQNAIEAVIHETQILRDRSIVKMRLLNDLTVNGSTINKGNFVFGKASLQGERLLIEISTIRKDNSLFPVHLAVYDLDGMQGIHIPAAITREVAKTSADNSLQNFGVNTYDPSFKAQATTAGINAAKSLLSRKVKQVKVTVKAGYRVLLRENQVNN